MGSDGNHVESINCNCSTRVRSLKFAKEMILDIVSRHDF